MAFYRPSLRAWGAIGVMAAWVGSLTWLGVRSMERGDGANLTSEAALRIGPSSVWFAITAGGVQLGNASITLDTLSPGYRIEQIVNLETPRDTGLQTATRRTDTRLAGTLEVRTVNSHYSRGTRATDWSLGMARDTAE